MSVEMMENDDKQESPNDPGARQYCKASDRGLGQNVSAGDSTDHGNKHSYFLRAKTPRYSVADGDGEFKRPSSISRVVGMEKERVSCNFLPPSRSKADHSDDRSEEEDLANCLVMLSNKPQSVCSDDNYKVRSEVVVEKGMFQCKACKKVFNSHQALGGHRASHKKVKGCFASKIEGLNDEENIVEEESSVQEDQEPPPEPRKRTKMHECSVCRRVFSSGQALGGHKRCHWLTTSSDNAFIPNFHDFQYDHHTQQLCKKPIFIKAHQYDQLDLNLNLTPLPQHDHNRDDDADDKNKYEGSTRLSLQTHHNQQKTGSDVVDRNGDEGCGLKLRKLSDLRDVNLDGGWLQMGIPSTSHMR